MPDSFFAAAMVSEPSQATIEFNYGMCNTSDGCDQSLNFTPANSGTTVVGEPNPTYPFYMVYFDSLESLTLHGSGGTVVTGVHGPGFSSILIRLEPVTLALLGLGLAGMGMAKRK